jgi:predicted MFS family arabinose efflux permease
MADPARETPRVHSASGVLVWGLALGQLIGWGTLYFAFALFVAPMEAELGWSRADLNGALTAGLLTTGVASIPCGWWTDRHGGHALMTAGALLGALSLLAWSFVDTRAAFYLAFVGIGLATAATVQDVAYAIAAANIADYRRAISSILLLGGLSSTAFYPLSNVLIGAFGWRHALQILAALELIPALIYFVLLPGTRGSRSGERISEATPDAAGSPLKAALARPAFWGLAICFSAQSFAFTAITFHMLPLLTERGLPLEASVAAMALIGPAQVAGRLALMVFAARASARTLGRIVVPMMPVAMALLLYVAPFGLAGLALFALVFGTANGIITIVRATGIAEILGTRGYGAISGAMNLILMAPRTAAPLAVAALWELQHGYDAVLWVLVSITAAGAAAFWIASLETRRSTVGSGQ